MTRVFLDANVLFSAALTKGGVARALFGVAEKRGDVTLLTTGYAVEEARALERKASRALYDLRGLMASITVPEEPPVQLVRRLAPLVPDPRDAPILAGAAFAGADLLVTGNTRDFEALYGTAGAWSPRAVSQGRSEPPLAGQVVFRSHQTRSCHRLVDPGATGYARSTKSSATTMIRYPARLGL